MSAPPIPPHQGLRVAPVPQHLPAYVEPLSSRIKSRASVHLSLHARLQPLYHTPQQLQQTIEELHRLRGALQSRRSEARLLQADLQKKEARVKQEVGWGGKMARSAIAPRHKARRNRYEVALDDVKRCRASLDDTRSKAEALEVEIEKREGERMRLTYGKGELAQVEEELDRLDEELFGGPTPECAWEDVLEMDYLVHVASRPLLRNSMTKESSCHSSLLLSQSHCKGLIKSLQSALQINVVSGLASNRKFSHSVFVSEGPKRTGRNTRADMLRAKGQLGDMMTHYIAARGKRGCVRPMREVGLIALEKAPGSNRGVSEQEYHASLQTSYAQARAAEAFIRSSIRASLARTEAAKERLARLEMEMVEKKGKLRECRRRIVEGVVRTGKLVRGSEVGYEEGDGNKGETQDLEFDDDDGQPRRLAKPSDSSTPAPPLMVATRNEMRQETDNRAMKLLRLMLKECEEKGNLVEDLNVDFEDRPGYYPYA